MEFTRLAFVYIHLIACCVAIGLVLMSDIAMVRNLFMNASGRHDREHLESLTKTVMIALFALWITGIVIVSLDVYVDGMRYFMNPKLQAKVIIVSLLTLNGAILHHSILPALQKAGSLLKLSMSSLAFAALAGSVSGVSWFYAAMLGVGRPLSWKYTLVELLIAYPVLIAGGTAMMLGLTFVAKYRLLLAFLEKHSRRELLRFDTSILHSQPAQ